MLTAEKMHLLLTRDDGRSRVPAHHGIALAAATLADLRRAGILRIEDGPATKARVQVTAAGTAEHPVLDALLPQVDALSGKTVAAAVGKGRPKAVKPVVAHLTQTGELMEHKAFLNTRHVPASSATRDALADGLAEAARGDSPSDEDVLLLGVLHHLNVTRAATPQAREEGESRREFGRRLTQLTRDDVLVQAVARTVGLSAATAAAASAVG